MVQAYSLAPNKDIENNQNNQEKITCIKQLIIYNKLLKDFYKIVTFKNLSISKNKF